MPKTEQVAHTHNDTTGNTIPTNMPTRDDETQEKLDKSEALLDEIDAILETETIEHELTMSDLIRGGSLLHPQTYGTLKDCQGTCALGAAIEEAERLGLVNTHLSEGPPF